MNKAFRNRPLNVQLALAFTATISLLAVLLGASFGFLTMRSLHAQAEERARVYAQSLADSISETMHVENLASLRARAESALSALDALSDETVPTDEAKVLAMRFLSDQVIQTEGYFFAVNSRGTVLVHPEESLLGEGFAEVEPVRQILASGQGYLEYEWQNPGESALRSKAGYAALYPKWDWYIVATDYTEGLLSRIPAAAISAILDSTTQFVADTAFIVERDTGKLLAQKGNGAFEPVGLQFQMRDTATTERMNYTFGRSLSYLAVAPIADTAASVGLVVDSDSYEQLMRDYLLFVIGSVMLACVAVSFLGRATADRVMAPVRRFLWHLEARLDNSQPHSPQRFPNLSTLLKRQMKVLVKLDYERKSRIEAEDRLLIAESVFVNTAEGICVTDADGTILRVNRSFSEITGYPESEAIGRNPRILKSERHPPEFYTEMWERLRRTGAWSGEIWNRRKNGVDYPELLSIQSVYDPTGTVERYVAVFHDLSQLQQTRDRVTYLATHDPLTGLANREQLTQSLTNEIALAQRADTNTAVFFIDIDSFADVNESFGHAAGDQLLIWMARRITYALSDAATIARFGADRFVVVCSDLSETPELVQTAEHLVELSRGTANIGGRSYRPSACVGVAVHPGSGSTAEELLQSADTALIDAKRSGAGSYRFYDPEIDAVVHRRLAVQQEARGGLERDEFFLLYQPIVDLDSGTIVSVEALLRWNHEGSVRSPGSFLPALEGSDVLTEIGAWAVGAACATAQRMAVPYTVSVNASAEDLVLPGYAEGVLGQIAALGFDPRQLCIEVTEQAAIHDYQRARRALATLREAGVTIALDDFGEGYSSLGYVREFGLDKVKLDRAFIARIPGDPEAKHLVRGFVEMIRGLGMTPIVEGVETAEQRDFLRSIGRVQAQGYFYTRPVRMNRVLQLQIAQLNSP